jgi:ribose 5-phosphate isomerase B
MRIAIGSDPNATTLKKIVTDEIDALGHKYVDFGSDDPIYANVVIKVAESVASGKFDRGIVMCGTGLGASIAANKVSGAYCALVTDIYQAERAALSNNANMIALGQQVTGSKIIQLMVQIYLANTENFDINGLSAAKVERIIEYARDHKS